MLIRQDNKNLKLNNKFIYNNEIVKDNLLLFLDAANSKSYSGEGSTWSDLSGTGNNGTINNTVYDNNGSFSFNGSTSIIDLGTTSIFNLTSNDNWTISIWAKRNSVNGYFISKGYSSASNQQYSIWGDTSGIQFNLGGVNRLYSVSLNDSWYFITMVCFGNSLIYGYINDTKVTEFTGGILDRSTTSTLLGGRRASSPNTGVGYVLNGNIGFVLIYNKSLTTEEIQQNYNSTKNRFL